MTGTIDLAFGPYDAVSRYDGTSNLEWEVFRGRESISLRAPDSGCRR
ncbi:MAG: hypothetical protein ACRDGR_09065 [bacterium]